MVTTTSRTLVLDNGAYTIKAGFSSPLIEEPASPRLIPNCIARDREKKIYVGSQLSTCKDFSEIVFRRPVEKGYLVNWEAEKEIWEHEFFDTGAKLFCDPKETNLILTEAPNAFPALQTNCDQVIFEEFGFQSYLRCLGNFFPRRTISIMILFNYINFSIATKLVQRCSGNYFQKFI